MDVPGRSHGHDEVDRLDPPVRDFFNPLSTLGQGADTMWKALVVATVFAPFLLSAPAVRAGDDASRHGSATLLVGDGGDDSIKRFDARTGAYLGPLIEPGGAGISGPMGLLWRRGNVLVVNQNIGRDLPGTVLSLDGESGRLVREVVSGSNPQAPFAPRGMVRSEGNVLHVADLGLQDDDCGREGRIATYDARTGRHLRDLDRSGFKPSFHPRGVVFGPDRLLYVSAIGCPVPSDDRFDPLIGYVLRFDPATGAFIDVFASHETVPDLHRPEGLVFDEHGDLWITSFRSSPADSDRILRLDRRTGRAVGQLVLAPPVASGGVRAFAQALVFGPGGDLFVPITGGGAAGEVRRCHTGKMQCRVLVSAGGALQSGWYAIFEGSDSATLAYED
jgi:hypothetical protein